ncbi:MULTISPECIES: hypothetical protein [unclassified Streptomyces]
MSGAVPDGASPRGTGGNPVAIITFGPVTLTGEDGTTSSFEVDLA